MKKIIFLPKRNLFSERRDNDILDITHLKNQILCYRISKNAISYFYKKNWFGIEFDNAGHVQAPYMFEIYLRIEWQTSLIPYITAYFSIIIFFLSNIMLQTKLNLEKISGALKIQGLEFNYISNMLLVMKIFKIPDIHKSDFLVLWLKNDAEIDYSVFP